MKLGFDRDMVMQLFTYMDGNADNMLRYPDFCGLCSEFGYKNGGPPPSELSRRHSEVSDPFLSVLRQMKSKGATAKGGRGTSHKVEKRIDNAHKRVQKENYDGVKNVDALRGSAEFVSSELKKFALKRGATPSGHGITSPAHNRVDSVRDESVYHSINCGSGGSAWQAVSGAPPSRESKFRASLKERLHGATSEQITLRRDPRQKANGGQVAGCINGDYERDFVLEAILNDRRFQERK